MTQAGKIHISATAKGLQSAELTFESQPVTIQNGLSKLVPGTNLTSNLERGATPKTPSYTVKRNPVSIVSASSPSNNEDTLQKL